MTFPRVWLSAICIFWFTCMVPAQPARPEIRGVESPTTELWFEPGGSGPFQRGTETVEDFNLQIRNVGQSAILMIVFKSPCPGQGDKPDQALEFCGTTKLSFHFGVSRAKPVEPGELRTFPWARYSSREPVLMLESVLFADGTSVGEREPYASDYLETLLPAVSYYDSLEPAALTALSEERRTRLERIKQTANDILAESHQLAHGRGQ